MTGLFFAILIIVIIFIIIPFVCSSTNDNSSKKIGEIGEARVKEILQNLPEGYHVLNDVVLKTEKGTTQIDHIVISKHAVFVIETKNYRGDIYGDDNRKEWTQLIVTDVNYENSWKTYTYVTKNRFYNPVKQSLGHTIRVKNLLTDYPHLPVLSIVVFSNEANLLNVKTNNYVISEKQLLSTISNHQTIYLTDSQLEEIIELLHQKNIRDSVDNNTHISNLKTAEKEVRNKLNSGICPKCGGKLIHRKGKFGSFWGCSNYPKCKFITR